MDSVYATFRRSANQRINAGTQTSYLIFCRLWSLTCGNQVLRLLGSRLLLCKC